jgi:hypothetical protein
MVPIFLLTCENEAIGRMHYPKEVSGHSQSYAEGQVSV